MMPQTVWHSLVRSTCLSLAIALLLLLAPVAAPTPVAHAANITVNSSAGTKVNGDGFCTLREAIENANNDTATWPECEAGSGADTIELPADAVISLTGGDNGSGIEINGLPRITSDITINGNNAIIQRSILMGIPDFRIFSVQGTGTLTLNNVTVRYGRTSVASTSGYGGGIEVRSFGTLIVNNSTITGNSTGNTTGAYNSGYGGGIDGQIHATLIITNSTISANSTGTVETGWRGNGGGISLNGGTLTVTNSTISGNTGGHNGGGIYIYPGTDSITSSTITGNTAERGGGIYVSTGSSAPTLRNTIVALNTASVEDENCGGLIVVNGGNNIDSGTTCHWYSMYGSISSVDPLLGPLANNGGPRLTHALQPGSRAINGVTYNAPNRSPSTDQRGIARPQIGAYDIGAFEVESTAFSFLPLILKH